MANDFKRLADRVDRACKADPYKTDEDKELDNIYRRIYEDDLLDLEKLWNE